jgi:hypothetical protein
MRQLILMDGRFSMQPVRRDHKAQRAQSHGSWAAILEIPATHS